MPGAHQNLAAMLASGALFLNACTAGGSPVGPLPAAPAPAVVTSGVPLNLQAANTTVTYQAASDTAIVTNTGARSAETAAAGQAKITLISDASGNLSKIVFNIPTSGGGVFSLQSPVMSGAVSLSSPDTIDFKRIAYNLLETNGFPSTYLSTLSQVAGSQSLNFSAYGLWVASNIGTAGPAGTFAIGNMTPAASVPATGSATFNGSTVGVGGASAIGADDALQGTVQIVANFATQSVTTNLTHLSTQHVGTNVVGSLPDLTGISTISGNAYSGPIAGAGLTGTVNGNFYGPAVQETAGVWQASGGGNTWLGSFGAK